MQDFFYTHGTVSTTKNGMWQTPNAPSIGYSPCAVVQWRRGGGEYRAAVAAVAHTCSYTQHAPPTRRGETSRLA
eukprot:scaffold4760_cov113-Isochrysis_galbana.AAC.6